MKRNIFIASLVVAVAIVAGLARTAASFGLLPWRMPTAADYDRTPVVFIHGQGLDSSTFRLMRLALRARGYPREYLSSIDFASNDAPNIPAAENELAPFIEDALARANAARSRAIREAPPLERVAIVAHSMGSLSSRWYIARVRPERIAAWISIAGPNHGSDLLCPQRPERGTLDMCPANARDPATNVLQVTLNGQPGPDVDETPWGFGTDSPGVQRIPPDPVRAIWYLTVRVPQDEYITPPDSVVIDGAGGLPWTPAPELQLQETSAGNFVMLDPVHHDAMLRDPRIIAFVRSALEFLDETRPAVRTGSVSARPGT